MKRNRVAEDNEILVDCEKWLRLIEVSTFASMFVEHLSEYIHEQYDCVPWIEFDLLEDAINK